MGLEHRANNPVSIKNLTAIETSTIVKLLRAYVPVGTKRTRRRRRISVPSAGLRGWMICGSSPGRGWEFFSSTPRPDRLWSPPITLINGYQGLFLRV
jgi:hypothetical protein